MSRTKIRHVPRAVLGVQRGCGGVVCVCVKVRGGGKTFPVLHSPKTGGNKHTHRLQLCSAGVREVLASGDQHRHIKNVQKGGVASG